MKRFAYATLASFACALSVFLFNLAVPHCSHAQTAFQKRLNALSAELSQSRAKISAEVVELGPRPKRVFAVSPDSALVPASVVKLITTAAALRDLGPEYRFPTEVFVDRLASDENVGLNKSAGLLDDSPDWTAGNLYVRGYGDPSLVDERLWELAREVKRRGIDRVGNLIIDDSLFKNPPGPSGPRPYEAGASATSLNHNCFALRVSPRGVGMKPVVDLSSGAPFEVQNRAITTARKASLSLSQKPASVGFTPEQMFRKDALGLVVGEREATISVVGGINRKAKLKTFYRTVPYPASFFASVFKEVLSQNGVEVGGKLIVGVTPPLAKRLLTFESKPLYQILDDLNHYSNNFIAMQILFALGQDTDGYFRTERGLDRLRLVLEDLGYARSDFSIADASGLSRANKVSAAQFVDLLKAMHADFSQFPYAVTSLSRFGASGTLLEREAVSEGALKAALRMEQADLERRGQSVWGKTGTLTGVSSLAGYLELANGNRAAYAILINGVAKSEAVVLEDKIVAALVGVKPSGGGIAAVNE